MGSTDVWSTDQLPEAVRLEAWSEKLSTLHLDWQLSPSRDGSCVAAELLYRRCGDMVVGDFRGSGFSGRRDPLLDTADVVGIQLTVSGRQPCGYADDEFTLGSEDLFVWGSGLGRAFDSVDGHREITVIVPRARTPRPLDHWLHSSRALTTRTGAGLLSIAADQMRGIARELGNLSDQALTVSVDMLLDTLGAAVAPAHETSDQERSTMLVQIQRYIVDRLDDPRMCAGSIATAHGISVRTLHLVFAGSGTSVGRWTREQRLEQCRRELSRADASTTVTDVAFRWGFSDAAHFSRAFKQTFGVTPSSVLPRHRTDRPPA